MKRIVSVLLVSALILAAGCDRENKSGKSSEYEEEIFYVKNPDELSPEDRDAYEIAQARCVNGGLEARQVGTRVRLRRGEVKAYLRFFYGLHRERKTRVKQPRAAEE